MFILKKIRKTWLMYIRHQRIGKKWAAAINNVDVSIISQNCLGGVIAHDAGLRFNSPFVNMWIPAGEFIDMLKSLETNLNGDLVDITENESYPVGLLNGKVHIHFIHYKSFDEVKMKWKNRLSRINYSNLRIVMTENDGCTYENLKEFDQLPFEYKVVFTHIKYDEIKSSFYLPGFEKLGRVAFAMGWKGLFGSRKCDIFDWVTFINGQKL